jgi:hypothetical protein
VQVLDMMIQHTFIDCAPNTGNFVKQVGTNSKTWCLGNSLVTCSTDENGVFETRIRRPAGVSVFISEFKNEMSRCSITQKNDNMMKWLFSNHQTTTQQYSKSVDSIIIEGGHTIDDYSPEKSELTRTRSRSVSHSTDVVNLQQKIDQSFNPGFYLLQLQPYPVVRDSYFGPVRVANDEFFTRAISVLDRTPTVDLHKVGVIYVSGSQKSEVDILSNSTGSFHYSEFLARLGSIFQLSNNSDIFTGGLDTSTECIDGHFAICAIPDQRLCQIIFHIATMMPNWPHDTNRTFKKRHIGNDLVMIVWNEGGFSYEFDTIPSQFNIAQIIIEPKSKGKFRDSTFLVSVNYRAGSGIVEPFPMLISGNALGPYVKQLCIFSSMIAQNHTATSASNVKERLRQIKRIRGRLENVQGPIGLVDFAELFA